MKNLKKSRIFLFLFSIFICLLLNSCALTLRSSSAFPKKLRTVYFSSEKSYSLLTTNLKELLRSMNVRLVKQKNQALFSMLITNDHFDYSRPDIVNTSQPASISFSQTATVTIQNNKNNQTIAFHDFATSNSLTLNVNQIYTANANNEMQTELNHDIASLIYYWLISSDLKRALHHANHHAQTA